MLYSAKVLKGYAIGATDDDIGKLDDFYFDDGSWTVRYLVAETGHWFLNRKVLISPFALSNVDMPGERLNVTLTKKQVEESPDIDTAKPVSRQHEASFHDYYDYPYYWSGPFLWGPFPEPRLPIETQRVIEKALAEREETKDVHLRSTNEVTGYHIAAADGDIGHADDFIVDAETWEIRYLVADTKNWRPGRKVLVAPLWIKRVSWIDSKVYMEPTRETIKNGPEYRPKALDRKYEEALYDYYKRPKYWDR